MKNMDIDSMDCVIKSVEGKPSPIFDEVGHVLRSDNSSKIQDKRTQKFLAQDYQDLTNQVIHKIFKLIQFLEEGSITLIRKFAFPTPLPVETKNNECLKGAIKRSK